MLIKVAKKIFKPSSDAYQLLSYWRNYSRRNYHPKKINSIVTIFENLSKTKPLIQFLQIGSNDGIAGDPLNYFINNRHWQGVLVEPVPFLFEALKKNYEHKKGKLIFLNLAVGAEDKDDVIMYVFDEKYIGQIPDWYYQLGSFNKKVIYAHHLPNAEKFLTEKKVPFRTIKTIIGLHPHLENLDVLHIDTEGFDFEILKTVNFAKLLPTVILIEYIHLDVPTRKVMINLLRQNNYTLYRCDQDYIAIQNNLMLLMAGTPILPYWRF